MARLSEKSLLAVAAIVDIAIHSRGQPVAAKALAERHNLPPRHLEPVLQALVHAGILKGVRGPRGGYELARERRRISVAEIARVAETTGAENATHIPVLVEKVVQPAVASAEQSFEVALSGVSIDELCREAEKLGLAQAMSSADFNI
jgi:Rrf2 family protein